MTTTYANLPTTKSGYVEGVQCGRNHGGSHRLAQSGANVECEGCLQFFSVPEVQRVLGTEPGSSRAGADLTRI